MSRPTTLRARARAQLTAEILQVATRHLSEGGAAELSLRAVAREMGMSSSAVYRYFPSRGHLLTALIRAAYLAMGEAAEQAEQKAERADLPGRWLAVVQAVHHWALSNPHHYALAGAAPEPGYWPPELSVEDAGRVGVLIFRIVQESHAAGQLDAEALRRAAGAMPPPLAQEMAKLSSLVLPEADPVPPEVAAAGVAAWTQLFGSVGFDVFGQYAGIFDNRAGYVDYAARQFAALLGLRRVDGST